jgi:hypothetical protein
MVFVEGDDYRQLRRPGDDPAQFRSLVRPAKAPLTPASVIYQYRGRNFNTSTWVDSAPSAPQSDLSNNGPAVSSINGNKAPSSDGTDDFSISTAAIGDGPERLPGLSPEMSVAMVVEGTDTSTINNWFGAFNGTSLFQLQTGLNDGGKPRLALFDNSRNKFDVRCDRGIMDGNANLVVIQKPTDDPADVNFYVNDMTTPTNKIVRSNGGFSSGNYTAPAEMGFFGRHDGGGSFLNFKAFKTSLIEFNEDVYSPDERQDLKQRAPGL